MRTVSEYLDLPYHRVIQPDESGFWSAHVLEFDGVSLHTRAATRAKIEGVSLNHLVVTALAAYMEHMAPAGVSLDD